MILEQPLQVDSYEFDNLNQRLLIRVIDTDQHFYNFQPGDVLIARGKDKAFYGIKTFYVYDLKTVRPLGCYFISSFEIIGKFDTLEDLQQSTYVQQGLQQCTTIEERSVEKVIETQPLLEIIEKVEENGQMVLFSFDF